MATLRKKSGSSGATLYASDVAESLTSRPGALASWFRIIVYCLLAIVIAKHLHYRLPEPKTHRGINPETGLNEFSEYNAVETMAYLSETIGYRIVGTTEEKQTFEYLEGVLDSHKKKAQGIPGAPKFEMWVQQETGSHRFDILDKMVLKQYVNVTNIIVRLSCPEDSTIGQNDRSCEKNAILMNSHFDTTLGSRGASDDGSGTAVMLEIIRVLSQRDWTSYKNSIVFLFNGAEETLQDASHMFITKHALKDTIRAVVNIDSCGTTGAEILFQANSREMIEAYKQAPYPHGTVMANDVFRTGLILSDTDFRQFVQYGNLTGIDLAIYKNSYLYHTHLDIVEHLEPGAIQHLGENTLAIVNYLALNTTMDNIEQASDVVFFDIHGLFFVSYSWKTAYILQTSTVIISLVFFAYTVKNTTKSSPYRTVGNILISYVKSIFSILLSLLASLLLPVTIALLITSDFMGRNMCWFAREWYPYLIFGPMSYIGAYGAQYLSYYLPGPQHVDMEYGTLISILAFFITFTGFTTQTGIASSYLLWIYSFILLAACAVNDLYLTSGQRRDKIRQPKVHKLTYLFTVFPIALLYNGYSYSLIDIFVPLTGRMGVDAPVDLIVSIMFGMVTFMTTLPTLAHVHRFGKKFLGKIIVFLVAIQSLVLVSVMISGGKYGGWAFPYDELHPKRIYIQHLKNLTSGEMSIGLAEADYGPYIHNIVDTIENKLEAAPIRHVKLEGENDWDVVYPFSAFLGGYKFDSTAFIRSKISDKELADTPNLLSLVDGPFPSLSVHDDTYDPQTGIRTFTVVSLSPGYIWNVISFDGAVVSWSIEGEEPQENSAHYIVRQITGHGNDGWKFTLSVKVPESESALAEAGEWKMRFQFTGLETENFAGLGAERLVGGVGVLTELRKAMPIWTTPTWLSSVVQVWHL
ncbi:hypothetical protein J3Q64DRAFT_1653385 [Phycomyces blakesleeanus]|uniref:Peptide hydrolase n=1 Tax=Phycomyces blakesleeanus TaxID=4837 RepID=A0ABR3BH67_PHYBL